MNLLSIFIAFAAGFIMCHAFFENRIEKGQAMYVSDKEYRCKESK